MEKKHHLGIFILVITLLLTMLTPSALAFQVKLHDRGHNVIEVQKYLAGLGYRVSADGIFGKETEDMIKDFQQQNKLKVDGIVGETTFQLMKKLISEKVSYELYIVDKGDTLSGIAKSRGISVRVIKNFNHLGSSRIRVGQDLKIPRQESAQNVKTSSPEVTKVEKIYYKVKIGDTLSGIAAKRNLPVEEIMNANQMSSDFIKAGQEIVLPITNFKEKAVSSKNSASGSKQSNKASDKKEKVVYQVRRGDALSTIARMYGTDVDTIRRNNNIQGDKIFAGDKLIITNYSRGPFSLQKNSLSWPVRGRITSPFGWRKHPIKNKRLFHNGIDIAVPKGTSVTAAAAGKVTYSGWMNGFGYTVIIDHGQGIETLYGHNSRVLVKKGVTVQRGQKVALSGSTGLSTGPHLHFGVLKNEKPLNPMNFLP